MKTTILTLIILIFFISIGFNQFNNKTKDKTILQSLLVGTEVFTLYKKVDNVFHVKKVLTTGENLFELYTYEINISTPESAQQKFISTQKIEHQNIESLKTELIKKYNWIPPKGKDVLFVQIQPIGFKDGLQLLNKRQEIEDKIDDALKNENLGEWTAGDIGPGGGNMLYNVTNTAVSLNKTLNVLANNNLINNVVIGKRIFVDKSDWFYEVVYPVKFTGTFNTM